jgi:hypothetical protein
MKHRLTFLVLSLILLAAGSLGQRPMDDDNERRVRIIRGPDIVNVTDDSATIRWITNSEGANNVRYHIVGSNDDWRSAYHQGGGTQHAVQLTGLRPGRTYEWQILTRDGDLRNSGQFQTPRRDYRDRHDGDRDDHDRDDYDRDDHDRDDHGAHGRDRDYANRIPLYRSSNRRGDLHLYTINGDEQNSHGFHAEGNAGYILSDQRRGLVPLYRIIGSNGDTLLTLNPNELDNLRPHGYRDGGVLGFVASTQMPGTRPLYRLVRRDGGAHFFTTSDRERLQFLRSGWGEEGPSGYIWIQQ